MTSRILVPIDGSPTAQRGLEEAIRLAVSQSASLLLLHVIDDFPKLREFASYEMLAQEQESRAHRPDAMLAAAVREAGAAGVAADSKVVFAVLDLPDTVVDIAAREGCDLIVIGTHGRRGLSRAMLGSVAEGVARRSAVPVLLVPPARTTAGPVADSPSSATA
ncbi:universal stress protein [Aquabacterium humicola]|uniref:universal stress protein n=1 Tax=Aquabacterium humicola TaxID=3237377 RepID=UPI002542EBC5|nr:universal stress protein [Rubrivivax pictus]